MKTITINYWTSRSCSACIETTPLFESARKYSAKRVSFIKYELEKLSAQYFSDNDIQAMPTLTVDVNGQRVEKIVGPADVEDFIKSGIQDYLFENNTQSPAPTQTDTNTPNNGNQDPYSAPIGRTLFKWGIGAFVAWKIYKAYNK